MRSILHVMMNQAERNQQQHAVDDDWLDRVLNYKMCASCLRDLPLDAFTPSDRNAGRHGKGRVTNCRECEATRKRRERARRTDH
jgi:hypothetical protein